jgi:hypothetical protein
MPGDYSRKLFNPEKHYSAVLEQQGRVQLDADWNEQVDIQQYHNASEAIDIIGATGVPKKNGGFYITPLPDGSDLIIAPGRIYVDGLLFELTAGINVSYKFQPHYLGADLSYFNIPSSPASPASPPNAALKDGTYIVYFEGCQRERNFHDDPDIQEVALGEADTTTRLQNIWQVKLLQVTMNIAAACKTQFAEWDSLIASSTGKLNAQTLQFDNTKKPCVIPPSGKYTGLENQLYRVQILKSGDNTTATFAWSRNNASVETNITLVSGSVLTVADIGKDAILGFANNQWVEIVEIEPTIHTTSLVQIDSVNKDTREITLKTSVAQYETKTGLKLRGWDITGNTLQNGFSIQNGWMDIENGVQVQFSNGTYTAGDYWMIPARTAINDIEWPKDSLQLPVAQPPVGIQRHYCKLALINAKSGKLIGTDCRPLFPSLTEICAEDICFNNTTCSFPDVQNVQQALNILCQKTGGGSCTFVVKPGKGWETVFASIPDGTDAQICFQVGLYPLDNPVIVTGKGNLKLVGCGPASMIIAANAEAAIVFVQCKTVTLRDLYAEAGSLDARHQSQGTNLKGVFTCNDCTAVNIDHLSLKSGASNSRNCTCITINNSVKTACPVRIEDCDLQIGNSQQGILVINTTTCWIERNSIRVYGSNILLANNSKLQLGIRNILMSNLHTGQISAASAANNVTVTSGDFSINFKSDQSLKKEWKQALITHYPTPVKSAAELQERVRKLAAKFATGTKLHTDLRLFTTVITDAVTTAQNKPIGAQGITIGGQRGKDIRVADNVITDVLQGIHVGASHKTNVRQPDAIDNLTISGNSISIVLPRAIGKQDRYGIFVGNCNNILIENNTIKLERLIGAENVLIDGIRVWGLFGPRIMINKNFLASVDNDQKKGFHNGINVHALNEIARQWLIMYNFAPSILTTVKITGGAISVPGTNTP